VRLILLVAAVCLVIVAIVGARDRAAAPLPAPRAAPSASASPSPRAGATPRPRALPRARCRGGVPGCVAVRGRVVYVESVDPDGDGDLHVVLLAGGVTAPGATAIDVRPGLRPRRDPRVGDLAAAAGPVQRGSFGQSQIHALAFAVRRR
jgi:hypothetical protein